LSHLQMSHITKNFPGVIANDEISLTVEEGEIHALLGENGSGKTTLMNALYGIYRPDSGKILIDHQEIKFESPSDAIKCGIGMVHQHFMLVPPLTVTENVILGISPESFQWNPILDRKTAEQKIENLASKHGLEIMPRSKIWQLPVGAQQRVEILKALYRNAEILILDEPTAVLTPQEVEDLFKVLRSLAKSGKSVVFISHKLNEVMEISDNITVLRNGRLEGAVSAADTTAKQLAEMMVGRQIASPRKSVGQRGDEVLEARNIKVKDDRDLTAVNEVSFSLSSGEILGVAGVDGNGQKELAEAIAGVRPLESGELKISGVPGSGPAKFTSIGHVTEDRHQTGMVKAFSLSENFALKMCHQQPYGDWKKLNINAMREKTLEAISAFDIKTPGPDVAISTLSGGNQQKLVMAKELSMKPKLFLAAQPTRGLDVGAAEYVHSRLLEARDQGMAILLLSTELEEVLSLSDRIIVMFEGKIMGTLNAEEASREKVGLMMAGTRFEDIGES